MKKLGLLLLVLTAVFTLTGCDSIYIEDDTIGIQFDTPEYRSGSLYVTIYLTNGYDVDEYVNNLYMTIYTPGDEYLIADAYFVIDEYIPADDYYEYELEFYDDSLFYSESEFEALGYELDDLVIYFDND